MRSFTPAIALEPVGNQIDRRFSHPNRGLPGFIDKSQSSLNIAHHHHNPGSELSTHYLRA